MTNPVEGDIADRLEVADPLPETTITSKGRGE